MPCTTLDVFPASYFCRHDERDDYIFYSLVREESYLNGAALEAFRILIGRLITSGITLLELMAGAHSYLPHELDRLHITGIGLNAEEMYRNSQLDKFLVQDLNRSPLLQFAERTFDAALCTCGIQYLTQPLEVFCEVNRVLKPHGIFLVSFTDKCFPQKAINLWLTTQLHQHQIIVRRYFEISGNWRDIRAIPDEWPLDVRTKHKFFAVWATKGQSNS